MSKAEDDWETDPDYVNDVSEKQQRWGSKLINKQQIYEENPDLNIADLRSKVVENHEKAVMGEYNDKKSLYGGK